MYDIIDNPFLSKQEFLNFCNKRDIRLKYSHLDFFEKEGLLKTFKSNDTEVYAKFQVYWIKKLVDSCRIMLGYNLSSITNVNIRDIYYKDEYIEIESNFTLKIKIANKSDDHCSMKYLEEQINTESMKKNFCDSFDWHNKKRRLFKLKKDFENFLDFILDVFDVYYPFNSQDNRYLYVFNHGEWIGEHEKFDIKEKVANSEINIDNIARWYYKLSQKAIHYLGGETASIYWIQLFKNISKSKKDKLEGKLKLGIDYLQFAHMLKKIIEDYKGNEILDIDEIRGIFYQSIIDLEPTKINTLASIRTFRNRVYQDKFYDSYKRNYYLVNEFGIDFQPRIIVFLEGKTEETIIPIIFEWYFGITPSEIGIEFINIKGINKFFGKEISIKDNKKYNKIILSNFEHLINYNLNKWQIIPFFIGDQENGIVELLNKGKSISFYGKEFTFPKEWSYIWGISNTNTPFIGKDFEMSNFSDEEISETLSIILNKTIESSTIQKLRDEKKGINKICDEIKNKKPDIAKDLIDRHIKGHHSIGSDVIFIRPIFRVLDIICEITRLNHKPINREIEIKNKEYILKILEKNDSSKAKSL